MKYLTIALAALIFAIPACKKNDDNKQKCTWTGTDNKSGNYWWRTNPSSDQLKKMQDSCACTITVNKNCVSCDVQLTDPAGNDIPCD